MARNIYCRLILTGLLKLNSPLHVGGFGEAVDTDMPLAQNGAGNLYIPGTSLAGTLREYITQIFGISLIEKLWGYQIHDKSNASSLIIDDMEITDSKKVIVEIRDNVRIDRKTGTAADRGKFDRAVIPRGAVMPLNLKIEVETEEDRSESIAMIVELQSALKEGLIQLGGAKTRGLGCIQLVGGGSLKEQKFSNRTEILSFLADPSGLEISQNDIDNAAQQIKKNGLTKLNFTIDWEPIGPLMVKSGIDGFAVDMIPLTSGNSGNKLSLVLPGSSVKGAVRSHAERIIRTLLGTTSKDNSELSDDLNLPLINEIFGRCAQSDKKETSLSSDTGTDKDTSINAGPLPGLGALKIRDCYGKNSFTQDQWSKIQSAKEDSDLRTALNSADLKHWQQGYHVAIDRWLGSASDHMLFSLLEPHEVKWEPLNFDLDFSRLPNDLQKPAITLILMMIRELASKRLPLGFGTHRGMGELKVNTVKISGTNLPDDLKFLLDKTLANGNISEIAKEDLKVLSNSWKEWLIQKQGVIA